MALVAAALCAACGRDPELKAPLPAVTETPVRIGPAVSTSCKPEPPVTIIVTARAVGPERYEVTATATAKAALDRVDLELVLPAGVTATAGKASFGAAASGDRNALVAIVETELRTTAISAVVRVPVEGIAMTKSATVTVGEPVPAPKTRQYATADGERAREVRP